MPRIFMKAEYNLRVGRKRQQGVKGDRNDRCYDRKCALDKVAAARRLDAAVSRALEMYDVYKLDEYILRKKDIQLKHETSCTLNSRELCFFTKCLLIIRLGLIFLLQFHSLWKSSGEVSMSKTICQWR